MRPKPRDDSLDSDNGDNQSNQINVSDSFETDGKFDKEKFYAYIKTKPKGVQAISDELEARLLKEIEKHQWNYRIWCIDNK